MRVWDEYKAEFESPLSQLKRSIYSGMRWLLEIFREDEELLIKKKI
jgi:hypothetical protein